MSHEIANKQLREVCNWNENIQLALEDLLPSKNIHAHGNVGDGLLWTPTNDLAAARDFIRAKKGSKSTERRYTREIYRFFLWINHAGVNGLRSIIPQDIEAYLMFCMSPPDDWCSNTGGDTPVSSPEWRPFKKRSERSTGRMANKPSVNSIQNTLSILKSFFSFTVNNGYLRGDPTRSISGNFKPNVMAAAAARGMQLQGTKGNDSNYPCRPAAESEGLTLTQWQCLQETIESMPQETDIQLLKYHRAKFVIQLLYYTGLRSDEARSHSHAAFQYDPYRECLIMIIHGKGSKKRIIPVHQVLANQLKCFRAFHGLPALPGETDELPPGQLPLFPSYRLYILMDDKTKKINPSMSERGAEEWIKSVYKKAEKRMKTHYQDEMTKTAISFEQATLHTLRHTRARHMLFDEKIDLRIVQAFLGHAKILTTQTYTNPSLDELVSAFGKYA